MPKVRRIQVAVVKIPNRKLSKLLNEILAFQEMLPACRDNFIQLNSVLSEQGQRLSKVGELVYETLNAQRLVKKNGPCPVCGGKFQLSKRPHGRKRR